MQKAQTRGGDRGRTVPSTYFQAVLPDLLDVHRCTRSGPQLGQVSLQKLLELSRELNSVGSVRCRGGSDAGAGSCNKHAHGVESAGFTMHTRVRASRFQKTLQDVSIARGNDLLDRLSCQTDSRMALPACNSALQTAPANLRLQTPSFTTTPSFQQTRLIQGTNHAAEPAQQRSCKLHRSPSRPTSVSSERIGSVTATGLLAHHRKLLMSADPSSPALGKDCPSGSGGTPPLSARRDDMIDLSRTHSMQQVQIASSLLHNAETAPPQSSLQLAQLQLTAALSQSSMLTSATLHKHDAAELPSKQESSAPSQVSDAELGPEASDSSSFFTDTADNGQTPWFLLGLGSSGLDFDDCLSVGTSQGIADGSSSIEDTDAAEGTSLRADSSSNGTLSSSAIHAALHARGVSKGCPSLTCVCFGQNGREQLHRAKQVLG